MKKSFGIIGPGNIGKIHARIFKQLDCQLTCILINKEAITKNTFEYFESLYCQPPKIISEESEFFSQNLDFIVIASPIDTHFDYLVKCLDLQIPVLCEKPLIAAKNLENFKQKVAKIKSYNGRFLVNTANTIFIDEIKRRLTLENTSKFCFSFHTHGKHKGLSIAIDLLPHATALMTSAFGYEGKISGLKSQISESNYKTKFSYSGKEISFDFKEKSSAQKKMTLAFDDQVFERQVSGTEETYKVNFINKSKGISFETNDPFFIYAKKFLRHEFQTATDLKNLELNGEILFNG